MGLNELYTGLSKNPFSDAFEMCVEMVAWCVKKSHAFRYDLQSQTRLEKRDMATAFSLRKGTFGIRKCQIRQGEIRDISDL